MMRIAGIILLLNVLKAATFAEAAPELSEILARLAEKSEAAEKALLRNAFAYERSSKVYYLDDYGNERKKSLRIYHVTPLDGEPVTRLVSINGRAATEEDQERRSDARKTGDRTRSLELSSDLLARYDFTFGGEEFLAGRKMWVLHFTPKKDLESDGFFDRLVNAMAGSLWVDQEDYQLGKADLRLSRKVAFFGGIAGAIEKLDVLLIQRRVEPEVWLGEAVTLDFSGRKLFSSIRFRCFESCYKFRKVSTPVELSIGE